MGEQPLNLYRLTDLRSAHRYDVYLGAVVAAIDEDDARTIHPNEYRELGACHTVWCAPEDVVVEFIGIAGDDIERGVIMTDFNAG